MQCHSADIETLRGLFHATPSHTMKEYIEDSGDTPMGEGSGTDTQPPTRTPPNPPTETDTTLNAGEGPAITDHPKMELSESAAAAISLVGCSGGDGSQSALDNGAEPLSGDTEMRTSQPETEVEGGEILHASDSGVTDQNPQDDISKRPRQPKPSKTERTLSQMKTMIDRALTVVDTIKQDYYPSSTGSIHISSTDTVSHKDARERYKEAQQLLGGVDQYLQEGGYSATADNIRVFTSHADVVHSSRATCKQLARDMVGHMKIQRNIHGPKWNSAEFEGLIGEICAAVTNDKARAREIKRSKRFIHSSIHDSLIHPRPIPR
ncbi:hypothetical protein KIPB_008069, partial [Kipferlia bialata]|eukprot:g8069.t1